MKDWFVDRGIPYSPEVYTGYGKDGPLDDAMTLALSTLMTNVDRPAYAFTDAMPTEVAAALFSRYSRSPRPLRLVLAQEFWGEEGLDLSQAGGFSVADVGKARRFFRRVLAEYGDDSVAQLGVVWLACEMVSQLTVKEIEDGRIGAWIEKSSRYVDFGNEVNGKYLYHRPAEITNYGQREQYEQLMDEAFRLYSAAATGLRSYLSEKFPRQDSVDEKVYKASIRAKAFDIARVYLPMATLTNVGMALSAQAVENMVNKMMTSPLFESRLWAEDIQTEVEQVIPSLVSRVREDKYGGQMRSYLGGAREKTMGLVLKVLGRQFLDGERRREPGVELVWGQTDAVERVVAAILFPHASSSLGQIRQLVESLGESEKRNLVEAYVSGRTDRRHKPGRAFEEAVYGFSITGNVGIWRDLQRMRMLTQQRQLLTVDLGLDIPGEFDHITIDGIGARQVYLDHMGKRADLFHLLASGISPEGAQYVVAFGNLMNWTVTSNLRELYHLIPLRAGAAGHPAYRKIAREMFYAIAEADPILAMPMERFIDFSDEPKLERLEQLAKVKRKLDSLGVSGTDTFVE